MDKQIRDIIKSTGQDQKETGDAGRKNQLEDKEQWKQLRKKKKKLVKKNLDLESRMKRTIKWRISVTSTMSYKNP